MSDIVAVLVVPAEGDPGGLMKHGACGAVTPMVVPPACRPEECDARGLVESVAYWHLHPVRGWPAFAGCALPLWWDGAEVPEGVDRALRVLNRCAVPVDVRKVGTTYEIGALLCLHSLASRVIRLTRVDGRLVELEPEVTP